MTKLTKCALVLLSVLAGCGKQLVQFGNCPSSEAYCEGLCTNTQTDPLNCGGCATDGGVACPPGELCNGRGQCATSCLGTEQLCNRLCTNTQTDPLNCGGCAGDGGMACPSGQLCNGNGECAASCLGGEALCEGLCTNPQTDSLNCGGCAGDGGAACAPGQSCNGAGHCATSCLVSEDLCNGLCTNTQTDSHNCGGCAGDGGTACAAGDLCNGSGVCAPSCLASETLCEGICVDTQTDSTNCGECDTYCVAPQMCSGLGACVSCPADENACGGSCRNLLWDSDNCNGCGRSCSSGACDGGLCVVPPCASPNVVCGNGCTDPFTDSSNCGGCADGGLDCSATDAGIDGGFAATPFCVAAACVSGLGNGSPAAAVDLGTAGNYVILAETGISVSGDSNITGNLGLSPAAATYLTGFGLIQDASNRFSTSSLVTGELFAADDASPTPANLTAAIRDMQTAFTAAAEAAPNAAELGAGDISGMTLAPGVYRWSTGLDISAAGVTLRGSLPGDGGPSTDVWIFQVGQDLTVANSAALTLTGGALARNVFWQVSGKVTLGTGVQFRGVVLCRTLIALDTTDTITGRLLAQTAVTLIADSVTNPP
jgi:hypothetical protein